MGRGWFSGPGVGVLDTRYVNVTGDTMTGALEVQANIRIRGNNELRFYDNGNFVGFEAPALAADQIWVLPAVDGAAGEALATDGGGVLSWGADHGALTGLDPDDDHGQYIFNAPLASARNVISAATATIRPLAIQTVDDDMTKNLTEWLDSTDVVTCLVNPAGAIMGGTTAGTTLVLQGTSHATVGQVQIPQAGSGNTQFRIYNSNDDANDGGLFLQSNSDNKGNVSCGTELVGSSWTARDPDASIWSVALGRQRWYQDTGLTPGNTYTPKQRLDLDTTHFNVIGNMRVGIGMTAGTDPPGGMLHVLNTAGTRIGFRLDAHAAQSANIVEIQDGSTNVLWLIEHDGGQAIQQAIITTGTPTPSLTITSAAHTTLAAGVGRPEVKFDFAADQQRATGAVAEQPYFDILAPTMSFVAASVVTDAMTVIIRGAPIAGANATLTRTAAFVVASGNVVFGAASVAKTLLTVDGHISITSNNEIRLYDNGNYVGFKAPALTGNQIWALPVADGRDGDVMFTDGSGNLKWGANASTRAFTFSSPSGGSGTIYAAGHYRFGASDNDFNPSISFGTTGAAYGDHIFIVAAAGAGGGTDTVIRVTGTSVTDAGVRTAADTEDLTADDAGAAGAYYETTLKWIGQVTIEKISGPDLLCNYGGTKYWDDNNENFKVEGVEATWLGGANDADPNILLRHHKATGWTYNIGSTPTPPAAIATMNTDYAPEIEVINGEEGAWKRTNLSTNIEGSGEEGVIIEITTTANKAFEIGNFLIRVVPQ